MYKIIYVHMYFWCVQCVRTTTTLSKAAVSPCHEDPSEVHPARQQGDGWEPSEGRRPRRQLW